MSKSYANRIELRDGAVMLYQKPSAKRPIWYYRIHIRGMHDLSGAKVKYDERSTGETDLDEAKRVALDRHEDLRVRVRRKEPIKSITFADLYELWWSQKSQKLNLNHSARARSGKVQRIGWFEKQSKRYWLAYFGKHKLEEMTHSLVEGYWTWRMAYWTNASETERTRFPNHAITPSKKTLGMEQSSLSEIFAWGNSMKLFSFQPVIRSPYSKLGIAATRRPSFDRHEWEKLSEYLDQWKVGNGKHDKDAGARLNSRHRYHRRLLDLYIRFIASTGMRPGEVLKLRHRDVFLEETKENQIRHMVVNVPEDTKTGARKVIGKPDLEDIIGNLNSLKLAMCNGSPSRNAEDWLFCDQKGKQCVGFGKTLQTVLRDVELLTDNRGMRRSSYSFRHFYAEQTFDELGYFARAYDLIGANMGTSRQMLDAHYVRKGIIHDQEAMLGLTATTAPIAKAKQKELDERAANGKRLAANIETQVIAIQDDDKIPPIAKKTVKARAVYKAFSNALDERQDVSNTVSQGGTVPPPSSDEPD